MFLFRPHRGSLSEAMAEVVELNDKAGLVLHIKYLWRQFLNHGLNINSDTIKVTEYGFDRRIGWNTHIVTQEVDGKIHVEGFTNGPVL